MDNSEDERYNKLDSSQQLDGIESNTIFHQENEILLTVEPSKSVSVSVIKPTRIIIISTFLQGLFLRYLHKDISNVVSLQPSLPVSLQDDFLPHLYKRHLYGCVPTIISIHISKEWISTIISTCISKD